MFSKYNDFKHSVADFQPPFYHNFLTDNSRDLLRVKESLLRGDRKPKPTKPNENPDRV